LLRTAFLRYRKMKLALVTGRKLEHSILSWLGPLVECRRPGRLSSVLSQPEYWVWPTEGATFCTGNQNDNEDSALNSQHKPIRPRIVLSNNDRTPPCTYCRSRNEFPKQEASQSKHDHEIVNITKYVCQSSIIPSIVRFSTVLIISVFKMHVPNYYRAYYAQAYEGSKV
jgi:hypothetical protein